MPEFISYHTLRKEHCIVVDGIHPNGLMLSHWKGAPVPKDCEHDTSAGIVINAIRKNIAGIDHPLVTATHYDIDGFIGVWALFNPQLALQYEAVLKEVAIIGDFREFKPGDPVSEEALPLVCWLNAKETELFYPPFGSENEMDDCAEKFAWFLPRFADVLQHPEAYRHEWEKEYREVKKDLEILNGPGACAVQYLHTGLTLVRAPQPLHYYALFSETIGSDAVVSVYEGRRYEVELKYTTWVTVHSRPSYPRVDLQPLAEMLNRQEKSGKVWIADKITDTGPILRLENTDLTKAERFDHPSRRVIHTSSIPETTFTGMVKNYFEQAYAGCKPKTGWTWEETRNFNKQSSENIA